jgi:hypothetical protein
MGGMKTSEQPVSPQVAEQIETCHPLVSDDWMRMSARLPVEIEALARETRALQRRREVKSGLDLLRIVLAYSVCGWSLRLVGAWATIIGLGHLSDVAVRKRLRNTLPWLGRIIGTWLGKRQQALAGRAVRVRLIDASVISEPGSSGTDWRLHARFDLAAFSMTGIEVTDVTGGETLKRHASAAGEISVADRGYAHRKGLGSIFAALAYIVVRITWQNLPLETADGQAFDPIRWLQAQSQHPCETSVWVETPAGRFEVRLVAQRLSEDKAEAARRRARTASRKKGHTPSKGTLFAAGYILLVTNLPAATWTTEQVLALYRLRWQVELLFKRLKGILHLDRLRAKDPVVAQVYLLGNLVGALLLEEWTADLAAGSVADWFEDTVRPVSPWRWLSLWADMLRQTIRGPVTLSRLLAALPHLARYLCDAPRKRRQQAACARQWLNAFALPMQMSHRVASHEPILA